MMFNSFHFLVFFPIVVLLYFILPKKLRMYWLLAASYYFYMCWNPLYVLLLLTSTALTYLSGLLLARADERAPAERKARIKKLCVAGSFVSNLAILFFFKYFNFAVQNLNAVLGALGVTLVQPTFDVLLPVGISFYTFQALSYTMDVYRGEISAEKNFFRYALFVSFFPQLVAGPIERSKNLLGQLETPKKFNYDRMISGLLMMAWGFFMKLVIADRAAVLVNQVYGSYAGYSGWTLVVATVAFAIQIYCDFGGYSAIAIGASEVLGVELMQNFRQPYFATSVADFWRRWHISLSTWFRDYLYIPMGGSRCGWLRRSFNLLVTFLVSGLWHGASWNYIVWGGLNGAFQVAGKELGRLTVKAKTALHIRDEKQTSFSRRFLKMGFTFVLVCATWVFFRAQSASQAIDIFRGMLSINNLWIFTDGTLFTLGLSQTEIGVLVAAILVLLLVDVLHERGAHLRPWIAKQELWFRWLLYLAVLFALLLFGVYGPAYDATSFLYFQF